MALLLAGFDLATTSGAAVLCGDRLLHAEAFRPRGNSDPEVFCQFRHWFAGFIDKWAVEHVAIEQPLRTDLSKAETHIEEDAHGSHAVRTHKQIGTMRTFLRLYGLRAHAVEICHWRRIECREVNNRTWRSKVYGKVSPPASCSDRSGWWKQTALDRCRDLRWPVTQKDAAESALIAEYLRIKLKEERLGISSPDGDLFAEEAA